MELVQNYFPMACTAEAGSFGHVVEAASFDSPHRDGKVGKLI